jgi:hypothetical protein
MHKEISHLRIWLSFQTDFDVMNPAQIKADAAQIAEAKYQGRYQPAGSTGLSVRCPTVPQRFLVPLQQCHEEWPHAYSDADRYIKTGDAVYSDIEKLILDHVPKISRNYENMKGILTDYRAGI